MYYRHVRGINVSGMNCLACCVKCWWLYFLIWCCIQVLLVSIYTTAARREREIFCDVLQSVQKKPTTSRSPPRQTGREMPPTTVKTAIANALEDLRCQDFDKFRHQLLDRREEPRIRRNKVEGKSFLDIADVMVSTFSEYEALRVTVELLTQIGCNQEAQALVRDTSG